LTNTSGTGEIFRLKEVRDVITSDFIVLPCDLVCELEGLSLLQEWMVQQAGFGGATGGIDEDTGRPIAQGSGGENIGRRGGLGVWYDTKGEGTLVVKGEQTDFIATVAVPDAIIPPRKGSIRSNISKVVMSIPTDTLKDMMEEQGSFKVRHSLLKKFGRIKMKTTMRDAHIYLLPFWVLDLMKNEKLDSVGEDVLGWWAKATWQDGLGEKLGLRDVLDPPAKHLQGDLANSTVNILDEEISVESYSSTRRIATPATSSESQTQFASRVQGSNPPKPVSHLVVPPILAYSHPSDATAPIIRRVDTTALLLAISVQLAALPATTGLPKGTKSSPLAHPLKIAHPDSIPRQTRIEKDNCLLAENVTVGEKCNIKETVIGAGCEIGVGARLLKCVLMEGVIIGENVSLSGCVLGRRCKIEGGPRKGDEKTDLRECEVQGGFVVPWGSKTLPPLSQ
jgi:translation initiation factor eIF-2B subunit gamma